MPKLLLLKLTKKKTVNPTKISVTICLLVLYSSILRSEPLRIISDSREKYVSVAYENSNDGVRLKIKQSDQEFPKEITFEGPLVFNAAYLSASGRVLCLTTFGEEKHIIFVSLNTMEIQYVDLTKIIKDHNLAPYSKVGGSNAAVKELWHNNLWLSSLEDTISLKCGPNSSECRNILPNEQVFEIIFVSNKPEIQFFVRRSGAQVVTSLPLRTLLSK